MNKLIITFISGRTALLKYGVAVLSVGLALILTMRLQMLGDDSPFALFFAAVMVSTWYGGKKPGLVAIVLAALVTDFFFIAPVYALLSVRAEILEIGTFIPVAALIIWLTTARQRSEKTLGESEERYRVIAETASDGIITIDGTSTILFANQAAEQMFGYTTKEMLGQSLTRLMPDYLRHVHPIGLDQYLTTGQKHLHRNSIELPGLHKSGQMMPLELSYGEFTKDGQHHFTGIIRDITERKRAEQELRKSEERYRDLVENAHDIIYTHDLEGNYTSVNQAGERITGYTREECLTMNLAQLVAPEYLDKARQILVRNLAGEEITAYDLEIIVKDGRRVAIEVDTRLILEEGMPVGLQGVARDITKRRQAEEALCDSEEQLRQAQKLESVGQLAGGIAHDFNNLLTVITGYSELMLRRLSAQDPLRRNTDEIRKAAERATALTRQLLAFSRKQTLQPKVLELNSLVTETSKMLRRLVGEDIEFIILVRPETGRVNADPGQIEQVLMNLVVNARDAMPQGGKLVIETCNVVLDRAYADLHLEVEPGAYVMLLVSDTGTGIDVETQKHIFEPFFTTKEVGTGTGLGLSTVYGIVKQSGGHIWVNSEVGKGTTFKICLPRVKAEAEAKQAAKLEAARGSETILLVEDEALVRVLAHTILAEKGYEVLEAANGNEALSICEQYRGEIHLTLTDVVMPLMSGRELADRLAQARPRMRVLYMSGYTDDAIVHHGVLDQGTPFLEKPFTLDALAQKVREVLDAQRPLFGNDYALRPATPLADARL